MSVVCQCDKCKKIIERSVRLSIIDMEEYKKVRFPRELDLCVSCYKDFNDFLNGGE